MPARLNTTDFAILGLLARRAWSAYELTQYMCNSNIRAVWPRAESRIYESPKKLVSLGFATTSKEKQGKRTRTVYHITPEGKDALAYWLEEESRAFSFEYESLLKLALGEIGDPQHRHTQLRKLAAEANADWDQMAAWFEQFAAGGFEELSGDRLVQNLLVNSFIKELLDARLRWTAFAEQLDKDFANCASEEAKAALVAQRYRHLLD